MVSSGAPSTRATQSTMARLLRGVSFCLTEQCREWKIAKFYLAPDFTRVYYCHICGSPCEMVADTFDYTGGQPFKQVRVEFDYDSVEHRYRQIAIVTNEDSAGTGVHTFRTAMIKTQQRALEIATARLSNLACGDDAERHFVLVNLDHSLEEVKRVCSLMRARTVGEVAATQAVV